MCGRYALSQKWDVLVERFILTNPNDIEQRFGFLDWHEKRIEPRFNIAPSQDILTIVRDDAAHGPHDQLARWGFAPFWADASTGKKRPPPINARAEALTTSAMFRDALVNGRCLIPATGFYEWRTQPGSGLKTPMHIRLKSGEVFAFAGLWTPGKHHGPPTAAIVTCAPNALMATIHNRMPVMLRRQDEDLWLDPEYPEPHKLLQPYPAEDMEAYPVAPLVNSFQNEGPELLVPVTLTASPQLSLWQPDEA
jgi:putative SOS response-associated peptidase YedK